MTYRVFSDAWTAGAYRMGLVYRLENAGKTYKKAITIPKDEPLWRLMDLDSYSSEKGELYISFTSGKENPEPPDEYDLNYKVGVGSFLLISDLLSISSLTNSRDSLRTLHLLFLPFQLGQIPLKCMAE